MLPTRSRRAHRFQGEPGTSATFTLQSGVGGNCTRCLLDAIQTLS